MKGGGHELSTIRPEELPTITPENLKSIIEDIIYVTNQDGKEERESKELKALVDAITETLPYRLSLYKDDVIKKIMIRQLCDDFIDVIDKSLSINETLDPIKIKKLRKFFDTL